MYMHGLAPQECVHRVAAGYLCVMCHVCVCMCVYVSACVVYMYGYLLQLCTHMYTPTDMNLLVQHIEQTASIADIYIYTYIIYIYIYIYIYMEDMRESFA
jgi:hypothetical protein